MRARRRSRPGADDGLFLRPGYTARDASHYFTDDPAGFTYQPHVYELAHYLAERAGLRRIVDIGCGQGSKLARFAGDYELTVIDTGDNLARLDPAISAARRIDADLEAGLPAAVGRDVGDAVVICADVVEHLVDPRPLVRGLAGLAERAPFVLVSTPDRSRARGPGDPGPPANPAHVREWTLDELLVFLAAEGFPQPTLPGFTINTDLHWAKSTALVLAGRYVAVDRDASPVRVAAVLTAYNEADILPEVLGHLRLQGVDVHVVDNWSTDGSYEFVNHLAGTDAGITVERFPDEASPNYEWARLLDHGASWAAGAGYDWVIHHDADELRYSPWPGVSLAEAIAFVDGLGFNAIDFTVIDFRFLADGAEASPPFEESVRFFEFGRRRGHFVQIKGWRQTPSVPVDLSSSGGHAAEFDGRQVFPLKFLTKHYPLRTKEQAERKVFRDRLPRTDEERAGRGWHTQYERFRDREITGWDRAGLAPWHDPIFTTEYLVERLSGIGIPREN